MHLCIYKCYNNSFCKTGNIYTNLFVCFYASGFLQYWHVSTKQLQQICQPIPKVALSDRDLVTVQWILDMFEKAVWDDLSKARCMHAFMFMLNSDTTIWMWQQESRLIKSGYCLVYSYLSMIYSQSAHSPLISGINMTYCSRKLLLFGYFLLVRPAWHQNYAMLKVTLISFSIVMLALIFAD